MNISINNLNKSFGKKDLFTDYSIEIEDGKITCIYGASGSGKTTLLNMIGFLEPYTGKILYDGIEVKKSKDKRKMLSDEIGFVFQDFGLVENETVLDNFKLILNYKEYKDWQDRVESALETVGLGGYQQRMIYELSGGEQQRVALARLFYKDANLILADEPTASLDQGNKEVVLSLLKKLKVRGKTIIIVSHDAEIVQFADITIHLK